MNEKIQQTSTEEYVTSAEQVAVQQGRFRRAAGAVLGVLSAPMRHVEASNDAQLDATFSELGKAIHDQNSTPVQRKQTSDRLSNMH